MTAEKPVQSPCISICALNEKDVCIGCYRSVAEITTWAGMDNGQRQVVLRRCRERSRTNNPFA